MEQVDDHQGIAREAKRTAGDVIAITRWATSTAGDVIAPLGDVTSTGRYVT